MKYTAAVLLALVAVATASSYFDIPENRAREKKVNTVNAQRQINVNYYAEKVGASSGTAKRDGVPGTPLGVTGYGYYPQAHHGAYYPAAHGAYYPAAHGAYYPAAHGAHYPAAHGAYYPAAHY